MNYSNNPDALSSAEAMNANEGGEPDEFVTPGSGAFLFDAGRADALEEAETDLDDFASYIGGLNLRHFSAHEFLVGGGSHSDPGSSCFGKNGPPPRSLWENIAPTARVLDLLRDRLGAPITLTSVYRNEAYNRCIGGAPLSQHRAFRATDFRCAAGSPKRWFEELDRMRGEGVFTGGIGLYATFVHVDTRGSNATW